MRIITLNTWGGRALHPLMHFFKKYADSTDVFCLQEVFDVDQATLDARHPDEHVRGDLFKKISAELPGFEGSFAYFDDVPSRQSLAIFFRGNLPVKTIGDVLVYVPPVPLETGSHVLSSRKLQTLTLDHAGKELLIANFHGLWNGGPKTDAPERLEQSRKVRAAIDAHDGPKVLCGDFNLLPDTESLAIMARGMRNMVAERGITSTRTPLYRKHDDPAEPKFADYMLLSPELSVTTFEVLPDVVSDHAALRVEIQ